MPVLWTLFWSQVQNVAPYGLLWRKIISSWPEQECYVTAFCEVRDSSPHSLFPWRGLKTAQNDKMVEVAKDLLRLYSPTPFLQAGLFRAICSVHLNTSQGRNPTSFLGNLSLCLIILSIKKLSVLFKWNLKKELNQMW